MKLTDQSFLPTVSHDLSLNCLYLSAEGEGIFLGIPQIFVRFQGCHVGCVNCDSPETWDFSKGMRYSLEEVLKQIELLSHRPYGLIKRVSITGGDPLHPKHVPSVQALVKVLKAKNYMINLEAAGTRIVRELFNQVDFISFDYKTPSTRVRTPIRNLQAMIQDYPQKMQIKSVIANKEDFEDVVTVFQTLGQQAESVPWVLTPAWDTHSPLSMDLFRFCLKETQELGLPFRVIGQQHKWLYGLEERQV